MSYRGRASYNRAPNCASRNTKPYIVTLTPLLFPTILTTTLSMLSVVMELIPPLFRQDLSLYLTKRPVFLYGMISSQVMFLTSTP